MKNDRLSPAHSTSAASGVGSAWSSFWFTPVDPSGLHWLRMLSGLLFICWLLPFAGHQEELFGLSGWYDRQAYQETARLPGGAPVPTGWSLVYLCGDNALLLHALYWTALLVFALFALGIATRITGVLTWVLVVSFVANPATSFDADFLLVVLAFYLMIGYLLIGQFSAPLTLRGRLVCTGAFLTPWRARPAAPPSYAANLAIRLLQVHFAVIFVVSGLHKLQIGDWWSGVAFWYWLYPPFAMNAEKLRALARTAEPLLFGLTLAQYIMLAWLVAFPAFAWRPRWRWLVLAGGVVGWLGSILVFGQPLFGPIYLLGCLSFLAPDAWQAVTERVRGLVSGFTGSVKPDTVKKVGVR